MQLWIDEKQAQIQPRWNRVLGEQILDARICGYASLSLWICNRGWGHGPYVSYVVIRFNLFLDAINKKILSIILISKCTVHEYYFAGISFLYPWPRFFFWKTMQNMWRNVRRFVIWDRVITNLGKLLLAGLPDEYRPIIMGIESSGITITAKNSKKINKNNQTAPTYDQYKIARKKSRIKIGFFKAKWWWPIARAWEFSAWEICALIKCETKTY